MPPPSAVDGELVEDDESNAASAVSPKELVSFILRAARKRWMLAAVTFVTVCGLTLAANALLPRTYHCDVRLHAQGQASNIRAFTNPGRLLPELESPTKGAADTLLRRDALIKMMRDARLVERWDEERLPALRAKDTVMGLLGGPASAADKELIILGLLEMRLTVIPEDQAVNIGIDWSTANTAFELAVVAQKNFIESRRTIEISVISDAIALLEARAKDERTALDVAIKEMQVAFDTAKGVKRGPPSPATATDPGAVTATASAAPAPAPARAASAPTRSPEPDKELIEKLAEKRRVIADTEQTRTRRLADLKAQLEEQRSSLGAAHPTLIATEKRLDALSEEPPELLALKNEERALFRQVNSDLRASIPAASRPAAAPGGRGAPATPLPIAATNVAQSRLDEDPQVAYAHGRFDVAFRKYEEMMGNLDSARAELDNAKAAFKYRYSVARPAEMPRSALKPKPIMIFGGGFGAAFLLALLLPAVMRLATGRVQEPWQVRTQLKLPVLGEVKLRSK